MRPIVLDTKPRVHPTEVVVVVGPSDVVRVSHSPKSDGRCREPPINRCYLRPPNILICHRLRAFRTRLCVLIWRDQHITTAIIRGLLFDELGSWGMRLESDLYCRVVGVSSESSQSDFRTGTVQSTAVLRTIVGQGAGVPEVPTAVVSR
jgi:hypothetical protein